MLEMTLKVRITVMAGPPTLMWWIEYRSASRNNPFCFVYLWNQKEIK